ncbi:MAG: hypothetical protein HEQ38_20615 [Gemmatimonas sp.]|nr:hypothetical protein [Gemmatimonas sp.]
MTVAQPSAISAGAFLLPRAAHDAHAFLQTQHEEQKREQTARRWRVLFAGYRAWMNAAA